MSGTGGQRIRIHAGRRIAVKRVKAKEPQDAQVILADPVTGIADESHPTRLKVGQARRAGSMIRPSASA